MPRKRLLRIFFSPKACCASARIRTSKACISGHRGIRRRGYVIAGLALARTSCSSCIHKSSSCLYQTVLEPSNMPRKEMTTNIPHRIQKLRETNASIWRITTPSQVSDALVRSKTQRGSLRHNYCKHYWRRTLLHYYISNSSFIVVTCKGWS